MILFAADFSQKVVLYIEGRKKGDGFMKNDQEIIELLFERDEGGLGLFEKKYKSLCLKLALDITGDELTAEECLNDLYLRLWNSIPPERPASLRSFACRIIRNLALNALKAQNRQKRSVILEELDECIPADMPDFESAEIGRLIDRFLESLPRLDALIFVRRYFYSDQVKRIAAKTGLTENSVSKMLAKTRKELKNYLLKGGISL